MGNLNWLYGEDSTNLVCEHDSNKKCDSSCVHFEDCNKVEKKLDSPVVNNVPAHDFPPFVKGGE